MNAGSSGLLIADYILIESKKLGRQLSPMQVNKLVYISHGYNLGLRGKALISDQVEAWQFGPVIPSIYHSFKHYKKDPIERLSVCGTSIDDLEGIDKRLDVIHDTVDKEGIQIINCVIDEYGSLSGNQLSSSTHRKGTPWEETYVKNQFYTKIPNQKIQEYYGVRA